MATGNRFYEMDFGIVLLSYCREYKQPLAKEKIIDGNLWYPETT